MLQTKKEDTFANAFKNKIKVHGFHSHYAAMNSFVFKDSIGQEVTLRFSHSEKNIELSLATLLDLSDVPKFKNVLIAFKELVVSLDKEFQFESIKISFIEPSIWLSSIEENISYLDSSIDREEAAELIGKLSKNNSFDTKNSIRFYIGFIDFIFSDFELGVPVRDEYSISYNKTIAYSAEQESAINFLLKGLREANISFSCSNDSLNKKCSLIFDLFNTTYLFVINEQGSLDILDEHGDSYLAFLDFEMSANDPMGPENFLGLLTNFLIQKSL